MSGVYLYDRPICTGLGDRMGLIFTLAALARLENATVVFPWCEDPTPVLQRLTRHIPRWRGYDYPRGELLLRFRIPEEIQVVANVTGAYDTLPRVRFEGVGLPAEQGLDAFPTTAWRTMRLGRVVSSAEEFASAYREVTRGFVVLTASLRPPQYPEGSYVALHLRGPDDNSYIPGEGAFEDDFCTGRVVRALQRKGWRIVAITNNASWANEHLPDSLAIRAPSSAYDDMMLMANARGIVQHAHNAWSSFSTVPAMARGIPIITTFAGRSSFLDTLQVVGGVPPGLYTCSRRRGFLNAIDSI